MAGTTGSRQGSEDDRELINQQPTDGVDIMRAQLVQEVQAKGSSRNKTLWIIYIVLVVFIGILGFVRLVSLFRRITWRNELDDKFPAACGSWAAQKGCTRVTLEESGCVRT